MKRLSAVLMILLGCAGFAPAQTVVGRISGMISDPFGADYNGADVFLLNGQRGPNRWLDTAAFSAPAFERSGTSGPTIVEAPGLRILDVSFRKQYRIDERFTPRFQADLFNALNKANLRGLSTNTSNVDFGSLTASGPARNVQMGLRLEF